MDESGKLPKIVMREGQRECSNGSSIMVRVMLLLLVPTIASSVYLARNAWILDERVSHIMRDAEITQYQLQKMVDRIIELERRQKP